MKAIFVQKGETLYYTPSEDVAPGSVVSLGTRIGVAAAGIPAGQQGTLQMEGVFRLAKAESDTAEMGAALYYDKEADAVTTTADSNVPAGYAAAPAGENDATVLVKLLG